MFKSLEEIKIEFTITFEYNDEIYEKEILDIFNNNITETNNPVILNILGKYYQYSEKNYEKMKECYLIAIELKNDNAMTNLGKYYQYIELNYDEMKKYYLMAIELGNSKAMSNLAYYYQVDEKKYDKMEKYYKMAIELNNSNAANNLGFYYNNIKKDYNKMKECYLLAIQLGNKNSMNNLGYYYNIIEPNYDKMKEYYLMAIKLDDINAAHNLGYYYESVEMDYNKSDEYYLIAIHLGSKKAMKYLESRYYHGREESLYNLLIKNYNKNDKNDLIKNRLKSLINGYNFKLGNPTNKIAENLYSCINTTNQRCSPDFKIKVVCNDEFKYYPVHSIILNSSYFDVFFRKEYKYQEYITINVNNFKAMDDFINYLYLDILPKDEESCNNLIKISTEFNFDELTNYLSIFI